MNTAKRKAELTASIASIKARIASIEAELENAINALHETQAELDELQGYALLDELGIEY